MKIFFYKCILVFSLFLIGFHYSFNYVVKFTKNEFNSKFSKENIEYLKNKIRSEMKDGIDKEILITKDDARLINDLLKKITSDLKENSK